MNTLSIVLICVCAVLLVAVIILGVKAFKTEREIDSLSQSINSFVNKGEKTDFSVRDNSFSRLQNGVADLEDIVENEKSKTLAENKKITEFISDISHQLKTPIAGLRLYCEMEHSVSPSSYTEKELKLIEKMENLVYKLLRLEKIKMDSYTMDFQPHRLEDIVSEVITAFSPLFSQKNFVVSGGGILRCDREWMAEAIGNLVKNACEHTEPEGSVFVDIYENDRSTVVEVCDNGGGVDKEILTDLFTRFYRTENAAPGSTGIGLAITKAIVEKHHGIISAENKNDGLCISMCFAHIDGYEAI